MNQQRTGEFLKHLRKNKGLTQEQLADHFFVSSRTVSRWETGSNMPDLDMLIELADFYDVDIREIIDGERKSENMDNETKDMLFDIIILSGAIIGAISVVAYHVNLFIEKIQNIFP